ncbi:MAG TPA: DUF2807 domain-containing protein [Legionellaceae bacterium]|nr:DUF2807 domain-containing protein [Legionellaceae bacterium]
MFKTWLMMICLLTPLVSCIHTRPITSSARPPQAPLYQLNDFNRIVASGHINLQIHTGARRPWITIHGDKRDTAVVHWTVKDHTMYIDLGKGYPKYGAVDVSLGSRYLLSLQYRGKGLVTGKRLLSKQLDLLIWNAHKTDLEGQMNLRHIVLGSSGTVHLKSGQSRAVELILKNKVRAQIEGISNVQKVTMSDQSWLSVFWVKSQGLRMYLKDQAQAQMAGIANKLYLQLQDHARFNGRYLRATEAFVKTYDDSEANIAVVKTQHTLASDKSNIYFYDSPRYKTDFMAKNGSVLEMQAWQ